MSDPTDYRLSEFSWTATAADALAEALAARDRLAAEIAEYEENLAHPATSAPIGTVLKRRDSETWYVVKYSKNDWISKNGAYWSGERITHGWEDFEEVKR